MTEGNISSWKVKEGDSFATGDVLLEIETDKATMDVEAQDDGIMAKIFAQDGSKSVQVGTRIAVLADEGDEISSLEIPADDSNPVSKPADNVKKAEEETPQKDKEASSSSYGSTETSAADAPTGTPANPRQSRKAPVSSPSGPHQNPKYPLYPSVIALIHENHLSDADVAKIPASGPQNRLLKGDVLAYLGSIEPEYSTKQSQRIEHMSHLDLSNIKVMPVSEKLAVPTTHQASALSMPEPIIGTDISLSISLAEVLKVQKHIQDSLGVDMPLATFLSRAIDIANDDLPIPKGAQPTADELFNAVLGLDNVSSSMSPGTSRGMYIPGISAMPVIASATRGIARPPMGGRKPDIIDVLSGRAPARTRPVRVPAASSAMPSSGGSTNVFTVTVPAGEERRAKVFLERVKTVLQVEPGRLVL